MRARRAPGALLVLALLGAPAAADAAPPPPRASALYEMALPARVALVAWLPAQAGPTEPAGAVVLDLRVEVVLPMACGDKVAGLLRQGGASVEPPDAYEVVIERQAISTCKKEPTRIGARAALRLVLPEGQARDLTVGLEAHRVERKGGAVTLDGQPAEGDVPGAAPTARPTTLVVGEVTAATLRSAARDATDAGSARAVVRVSGRFPSCAGPPLGLLGRGDVTTGFALTRFQPLAVARQDEACGAKKVARTADLEAVVRLPRGADRARITVGTTALEVAVAAPAAASGPAR